MICDRFQMVVMDTSEEADKSKLYREIQAFLDHFEMTFSEKNLEGIKLCKNTTMTEEMTRRDHENSKNKVLRGLQEKNLTKKTFNQVIIFPDPDTERLISKDEKMSMKQNIDKLNLEQKKEIVNIVQSQIKSDSGVFEFQLDELPKSIFLQLKTYVEEQTVINLRKQRRREADQKRRQRNKIKMHEDIKSTENDQKPLVQKQLNPLQAN